MGKILIGIFAGICGSCFCIFNWWFQREKFKRMPEDRKKKVSVFNRPSAWICYSLVFILLLFFIIGQNAIELIIKLYTEVAKYQ